MCVCVCENVFVWLFRYSGSRYGNICFCFIFIVSMVSLVSLVSLHFYARCGTDLVYV